MSNAELGEIINEFGHVTDPFQQRANVAFISHLHGTIKEGGVWGWPEAGRVYKKVGEGWELVE